MRCKGVYCVDLGESLQTHIYLQNLASVQPRTSPPKFGRSPKKADGDAPRGRRGRRGREVLARRRPREQHLSFSKSVRSFVRPSSRCDLKSV